MKSVDQIIEHIIRVEGDRYTDLPNDRGGPTKYGITLETLKRFRGSRPTTAEDVKNLTKEEARRIYRDLYVVNPGFVHIVALDEAVGAELVDSGVNVGPTRAAKWLQTALNAFNRSYRNPPDYLELKVDGVIGPKTVAAMHAFISMRGAVNARSVLLRALNSQQGAHYLNLAQRDETQEQFAYGWFLQRVA